MDNDKKKALQSALSQIEKQFGKGAIMRMGENEVAKDLQVVSTGSLGLDLALGAGLDVGLAALALARPFPLPFPLSFLLLACKVETLEP